MNAFEVWGNVAAAVFAAGWLWMPVAWYLGRPDLERPGYAVIVVGCVNCSAWAFMSGAYGFGVLMAVWGGVAAWQWWRRRPPRDRRKALRELGAKSRARVQALVERMQPEPAHNPV